METLIFALIASYMAYQRQEQVVAEPEEFQAFFLDSLRNSTDNKPLGGNPLRTEYFIQRYGQKLEAEVA
jgi:hypothetical protein